MLYETLAACLVARCLQCGDLQLHSSFRSLLARRSQRYWNRAKSIISKITTRTSIPIIEITVRVNYPDLQIWAYVLIFIKFLNTKILKNIT